MRKLIAKLINGEISRRDFTARVLGMGFGMMTVESILDTVAVAGNRKDRGTFKHPETFRAEPFSEKTPYEQWIDSEGVPVHTGYLVPDVRAAEVKSWKRLGAKGAIINLEGAEATDGSYVCEIAPGAGTNPQRYMFEESIYVLDGEGETSVWHENRPKQTFKWKKGTLFSPPLNTWRVHKNTGRGRARFISVTDLPLVMDLYHNADFIFNNDFVFRDRYDNQPDYFTVNESKMRIAGSAATFGEGEKGAVGVRKRSEKQERGGDPFGQLDADSRLGIRSRYLQTRAPARSWVARAGDEWSRLYPDVDQCATVFRSP